MRCEARFSDINIGELPPRSTEMSLEPSVVLELSHFLAILAKGSYSSSVVVRRVGASSRRDIPPCSWRLRTAPVSPWPPHPTVSPPDGGKRRVTGRGLHYPIRVGDGTQGLLMATVNLRR